LLYIDDMVIAMMHMLFGNETNECFWSTYIETNPYTYVEIQKVESKQDGIMYICT
jgi:hypothetical protein